MSAERRTDRSLGLPPRPEPDPEIVALIAAAVDQAWPRTVAEPEALGEPSYLRWRFSGRWWAQPTVARRDRPWIAPPAS